MIIIGFSGKRGTGKSTIARACSRSYKMPVIRAFADLLKIETSSYFGFSKTFCYSEEGKSKEIDLSSFKWPAANEMANPAKAVSPGMYTVRSLMQWYGTEYRRFQNERYWIDAMVMSMVEAHNQRMDVFIIDDVRFKNEAEFVLENEGYLVRINPHPDWSPCEHSDHPSETELDNFHKWNLVFTPGKGETDIVAKSVNLNIGLYPKSLSSINMFQVSRRATCR